jgi:CDP-diacylglycerol---glycerol-3-phosphate 3-phosphatidyltransferase
MLNALRAPIARVMTPTSAALLRLGVTPDMVTVAGTVGAVAGGVGLLAQGQFVLGSIVITLCALLDSLDGVMARMRGGTSLFGAFLDSTLDRVADAAIFGGLAWWLLRGGDEPLLGALALYCLVAGSVTSYAKARAEGLGMTCNVGIAERAERLVLILAGVGFSGLGVPYLLAAVLWLLTAATTITVGQRIAEVARQSRARSRPRPAS